MRDEDHAGVERRELALEPLEALDVEVVRRLVEQQEVGVARRARGRARRASARRPRTSAAAGRGRGRRSRARARRRPRGRASRSRRRARAAPGRPRSGRASPASWSPAAIAVSSRRSSSSSATRSAAPERTYSRSVSSRSSGGRWSWSAIRAPFSNTISPPCSSVSPAIARSSVVLPAPFGPESATRSRRSTLSATFVEQHVGAELLAEAGCDQDGHAHRVVAAANIVRSDRIARPRDTCRCRRSSSSRSTRSAPSRWTRCSRRTPATPARRWRSRRSPTCSTPEHLRHNPADPDWPDRDRFVLSAGHACILQYAALHLTGYDLPLDAARALPPVGLDHAGASRARPDARGSRRPPARSARAFANGVGFALAERFLARALQPAAPRGRRPPRLRDLLRRRPDGGRLQRGGLDRRPERPRQARLLLRRQPDHDRRHDVGLASRPRTAARGSRPRAGTSSTSTTRTTSTRSTPRSRRRRRRPARPSLIVVRSHIAYPAPHAIDTAKAHGAPLGADEVAAAKEAMGWDPEKHFYVPDGGLRAHEPGRARRGAPARVGRAARRRGAPRSPTRAPTGTRCTRGRPRAGLDRGAARVPGRRGRGHARRRQGRDAGAQAVHADDGRRLGRPRRVDEDRVRRRRPLLGDARGPQHRLRDPRARDGLDRERALAARRDAQAVRRHVLRLLRLHAPRRAPLGARALPGRLGLDARLDRRSARTGPRTSPSST